MTTSEPTNIRLRLDAVDVYCRAAGISRAKLCRLMDMDPTTLWRIKEGQRDPSPRFIAAICNVTGKSFDDLFEIVRAAA